MQAEQVFTVGQHALMVLLMVAAPILLTVLVVGVVVSILQAATQINEATLSFVPKLLAAMGVTVVMGPWMVSVLVDFLRQTLLSLATAAG